ncbi:MAG: hypothetical protein V9G10_10630 [Candidatus Nanopelagicales bacterium]
MGESADRYMPSGNGDSIRQAMAYERCGVAVANISVRNGKGSRVASTIQRAVVLSPCVLVARSRPS